MQRDENEKVLYVQTNGCSVYMHTNIQNDVLKITTQIYEERELIDV